MVLESAFQEIFPISDPTIEIFYQCGLRLYNSQQYQKAVDVFFVICSIDYRRHNAWLALGLTEKSLQNWDAALHSFSMGALTNIKNPISFLHSADCYAALGQAHDAKECIEISKKLLHGKSDALSLQLLEHIISIENSLS